MDKVMKFEQILTGETRELTKEQIDNFNKAYQESIDSDIRALFGKSPKFEGTFVWPIPATKEDNLRSIISLDCSV